MRGVVPAAYNAPAEREVIPMTVAPIRTPDSALRDQQWSRLRELTSEFLEGQEVVQHLRAAIHAAQTALAWEWQFLDCDMEVIRILKKRITSRLYALKMATDTLSSIQSELESLQTALGDNYEVSANDG